MDKNTARVIKKLELALSLMAPQHVLDEPDKTQVEQLIEEALRLLKENEKEKPPA